MRLRLGLIIGAVLATLLLPITPQAQALGGYASAPLNVSSTAIAGGLRVTWSLPTDIDTGVTGYKVEYSTSGTANTWTVATTTNSSTFTHDILGLNQTATYVRVAATTTAGTGTYGYPWTKLYSTIQRQRNADGTIQYESGFGLGVNDPYTTLQSSSFTRVRYLFNTTLSENSVTKYADVDFYKWADVGDSTKTTAVSSNATIRTLSIPTTTGTTHIVQANVTDMNVFSDHDGASDARAINGRLELWGIDYGFATSGLAGTGSSASFDYDDSPAGGSYGSFQVHNMSTLEPVFVWNHHLYGYNADLNYGKNITAGAQPDSTFCNDNNGNGTCPAMSAFKLQIFANTPVTPLADATPPTVSRIDSRAIGKNGDTVTVRSTELGTVYLVNQSVSVTNLASITAASATNKNSVSISAINTNTVITLASLNEGRYNLYAADSSGNLSAAIQATINVDNTLPTAQSIVVNSAGTAVTLTASETITNSLQVAGIYTISDSGSAISVSATSFAGNVATITLNRSIPAGASVTFSYTPSAGVAAGRWIDHAGNEMAAITTRSITNNSSSPISVTLTVADPISKGSSTTMTASVSVTGRVTFSIAGKRIPGCLNKSATGTTPISVTCTFKPALSAQQRITATLVPTLGAYPTTVTSVNRFILKRSNRR